MKKVILIMLLFILGLNAQVYDLLGTAQRIKALNVNPSFVSFDGTDDKYNGVNWGNIYEWEGYIYPTADNKDIIDFNGTDKVSISSGAISQVGFDSVFVNGVYTSTITLNAWNLVHVTSTTAVNASAVVKGYKTTYYAGRWSFDKPYNRQLSASERVTHYNYGHPELYEPPYADRGASNTELLSSFAQGTTYSYDVLTTSGLDITSAIESTGNIGGAVSSNSFNLIAGKKYRFTCDYTLNSGVVPSLRTVLANDGRSTASGGLLTTLSDEVEFTATSSGAVYLEISVGTSNVTNFSATGISLKQIGEVASYSADNATSYSWIDGTGGNSHAQGSGSPTAVRSEKIGTIKQFKGSIAANTNTTLTSIIPKGYRIRAIRAVGSDSLAAIKIGTSSAGEEIVASTTTTGTTASLLTLAATSNTAYSETADVTLYARHDTGASGKTMNLILILEKVNF